MTGRRVDRGRQTLQVFVGLALVVVILTGIEVVHRIGHRDGRPHVVQLVTPTEPGLRTASSAAP